MKPAFLIVLLFSLSLACSTKNDQAAAKRLLVHQLKTSHAKQDWFVPTKVALQNLSVEQVDWRDSTSNNSIRELVSHLIFWNEVNLKAFKGEKVPDVTFDNNASFRNLDGKNWKASVSTLDSIQSEWEEVIQNATEKQIAEWSTEIAGMNAHSAYHTGQIIYIRKHNGWWE